MLETLLQPNDVNERCGLLLKDDSIVEIVNVSENPEQSYEMEPTTVLPFLKADAVAATWHTHPGHDSNLSEKDRECFMAYPDLDHIIIGTDGLTRYRVEDGVLVICD